MISKDYILKLQKIFAHKKVTQISLVLACICLSAIWFFSDNHVIDSSTQLRPSLTAKVIEIKPTSVRSVVMGYGTVEPSRVLEIRPLVTGHVLRMDSQFQVGGHIPAGEVLLQLDTRDFELALQSYEAAVANAQSDLKQEQGNQVIAKYEWQLLNKEMDTIEGDKELALRIPNLKAKEAALRAAESQLRKAELDLQRTAILTPFDSLVLEKNVERGSFVDPYTAIGKIASTDKFYITVHVPDNDISLLIFDKENGTLTSDNQVKIMRSTQSGIEQVFLGQIERLLGTVEASGRMAQLLVSVDNPLVSRDGFAPLLLGTYVQVEITGREIQDAIRIPNKALREENAVYVVDSNNRLRIRKPKIIYTKDTDTIVREGFKQGDRPIISNISTPIEGMLLEVETEQLKE